MLPRADARQDVWAASKAYLEGDNIEQAIKLLPKNGGPHFARDFGCRMEFVHVLLVMMVCMARTSGL